MFPLVPYHQLPKLHQLIKDDCPTPYSGLFEAYQEIIPAVSKQIKDPTYYVKRKLPKRDSRSKSSTDGQAKTFRSETPVDAEGWVEICDASHLGQEDVIRFDHDHHTYAIYQTKEGSYHATAGICTHGNTHLAEGLVIGNLIECPKHNGRFNFKDGSPVRKPVCTALKTYSVKCEHGALWINTAAIGCSFEKPEKTHHFKVVSNKNVSTFIRELVIEPLEGTLLDYKPGEYLQFDIPEYENISLADMQIDAPFAETWENLVKETITPASNKIPARRNYSLASNPEKDTHLKFNIRIALPPQGSEHPLGSGSSYMHRLHPGDEISAIGPFGDFHIKETEKEMVYLGGGAGMAPLRSHISYLLETLDSNRKISLWYGARSEKELFYDDYFKTLAEKYPNFSFHVALSDDPENANFPKGFIHQHLQDTYLKQHENVAEIEFYLCGPPPMIKAGTAMLKELNVSETNIAFDEFS
jgi:MocE subfamily Rieske [2Fe-2S] domain protein